MKKLISAILIAIMLLSFAAPALAATKIYATGSVNLRSGPGLDYKKLGSVSKGTSLKYLGETSTDGRGVKWYKVSYKGQTAWISSRYSSTKKGGSSSSSSSSSSSNSSGSGKVTATGSVNLRSGPGLDYKKLGAIEKGTSLKYLGETSTDDRGVKWYKVSYKGNTAWISSRYSSKKGGSSSSSSSSSSNSAPLPKPTTSASNKVTTKGTVNLRTGPGTGYNIVTAVQKGSSMKYLGESSTDKNGNKWYKVSYDGREVWICGRYVTLTNNGSNVSSSSDSGSTADDSTVNPFETTTTTPDLTGDTVPGTQQSTLEAVTAAPSDYVEMSGYYRTGLLETAVVLGIDGYRKVETEVPNQYFNDSLTIAGNTAVEYIGLRGKGYTVYGVCVGMTIENAKQLLTAAGLELYDGSWVTMFHHPTGETDASGAAVYDYSINLYTNQDGLVTELDWSTYTS